MKGPLYHFRGIIATHLMSLGLKDGDVFYRSSKAKGPPFGLLPFTYLVEKLTESKYSHAAILIHLGEAESRQPFLLEVNDTGTTLIPLKDWLETCRTNDLIIQRHVNLDETLEKSLREKILFLIDKDPSYDFTFKDEQRFYCTEAVNWVYNEVGLEPWKSYYIFEITSAFQLYVLEWGSWFTSFFGASLPFDRKLYFVGNKDTGMLNSDSMKTVFSSENFS